MSERGDKLTKIDARNGNPQPMTEQRTLIFCTTASPGIGPDLDYWQKRVRRWIDAVRASRIAHSQILLIDDGSTNFPGWADTTSLTELALSPSEAPVVFFGFQNRLGRGTGHFPGWYRSFVFCSEYAARYGFTKVVHIESDAYLISRRMVDFVNNLESGWTMFWCPRHRFPESSIQIIAGDSLHTYRRLQSVAYAEFHRENSIERLLPATQILKSFIGDRYSEYRQDVPRNADFVAQTHFGFPDDYYWWLNDGAKSAFSGLTS